MYVLYLPIVSRSVDEELKGSPTFFSNNGPVNPSVSFMSPRGSKCLGMAAVYIGMLCSDRGRAKGERENGNKVN